jgi:hypothetical protein
MHNYETIQLSKKNYEAPTFLLILKLFFFFFFSVEIRIKPNMGTDNKPGFRLAETLLALLVTIL